MRILQSLVIISLLALVAGCAKIPQESIDEAKAAFENAGSSGAQQYAPGSFAAAKAASSQLSAELAAQEGKSKLTRSYGRVEELATKLLDASNEALQYAAEAKQERKTELEADLSQVLSALEETEVSYERAKSVRGTKIDKEETSTQIALARSLANDASTDIADEKYVDAGAKLQEASLILEDVGSIIETALFTPQRR